MASLPTVNRQSNRRLTLGIVHPSFLNRSFWGPGRYLLRHHLWVPSQSSHVVTTTMRFAAVCIALLCRSINALQKTTCNGAARTTYGRSTAKRNSDAALTNSAPFHRRRPLSHAATADQKDHSDERQLSEHVCRLPATNEICVSVDVTRIDFV